MRPDSPWAEGPAEILVYAIRLLEEDTDPARRLAMILADNAVELTIRTYLGLPKRITGIKVPRKDLLELGMTFPGILDCLERYGADRLQGVDLAVIEWQHQLRNQLYHHGNGLTIPRSSVQVYIELANLLFKNLFGFPIVVPRDDGARRLGTFLELWIRLERNLDSFASTFTMPHSRQRPAFESAPVLREFLSGDEFKNLKKLRHVRNELVHGRISATEAVTSERLQFLEELVARFEEDTES